MMINQGCEIEMPTRHVEQIQMDVDCVDKEFTVKPKRQCKVAYETVLWGVFGVMTVFIIAERFIGHGDNLLHRNGMSPFFLGMFKNSLENEVFFNHFNIWETFVINKMNYICNNMRNNPLQSSTLVLFS